MTVTLPWYPKELNPNQRCHWAIKAKKVKEYRNACAVLTRQVKFDIPEEGRIRIIVDFYPPDRRHRDADNMVASVKALLDGVADALEVNDKRFLPTFKFHEDIGGMIKVSIDS